MSLDPRHAWIRQIAAFVVLLALWELAGRAGMLNPMLCADAEPGRRGAR